LLAQKPFDEASVAEIVDRAGTSVGAFYGRFPDKDSLLDCFDERFFELARASTAEFFESDEWRAASLGESVEHFVRLLVCSHRRHRGILRALALRAREPSQSRFRERAARHNRFVLELVQGHLLLRSEPIAHPDPARAVELGFLFTVAAIREAVLFDNVNGLATPGDGELVTELARFFLGYLTTGQTGAARPRSTHPSVKPRGQTLAQGLAGRSGVRRRRRRNA
jgi:AcrR family transcriptional regulator